MSLTHEICIIGCGPVGLLLANCLARSPHIKSLALIDRKLPQIIKTPPAIPNQRVYSINRSNLDLLQKLGVRELIRNFGQMENIHVVSKQSQQCIDWSGNSAEVIENNQLVSALRLCLQQRFSNKIQFIETELSNFQNQSNLCNISLANGQNLKSSLLVGSDGNQSKVKKIAKIATYGWSHRQKGIVCALELEHGSDFQNNSAYQIYYEGNTLAVLPLWGNYVSIVWSLKLPEVDYLSSLSDEHFVRVLNQVLQNGSKYSHNKFPVLGSMQNSRLAFPLQSLQADRYSGERIALIGDAAHSIHPMAGMGVNSGFYDATFLANNIILNKKTGNDIGNEIALSKFQSQSKKLNYSNSLAMEGIKKAFEIDFTPFNFARKFGMQMMGSAMIKQQLRQAAESHPFAQGTEYEWQKS